MDAFVGVATHIAHHANVTVTSVHVGLQVILDLELLIAQLAREVEAVRVLADEVVLQGPLVATYVVADVAGIFFGTVDGRHVGL